MSGNGIAKVQHYVPQFLLRKFGNGKKDQLHVFDKQTGRTFVTNARNVASESRFYDFQLGEVNATIEPSLSKLEANTKLLFERMLELDSVDALNPTEKIEVCAFFAVQFTRTRNFRERWRALPEMLGEKLKSMTRSLEDLESISEYITASDENEVKIQSARMMATAPRDFGAHFANKTWHLLSTTCKVPFFISDNPLTLQNMNDMKPYGNLGLAVHGIEIYFPLSPTRALAMWCPSHQENILRIDEQLRLLRVAAPHLVESQIKDSGGIDALARALESRKPIPYSAENVLNFNSLQVANAERYVFSSLDDFALPRKMIAAHPSLRTGPRMKVG
jgi:hypothetical protein